MKKFNSIGAGILMMSMYPVTMTKEQIDQWIKEIESSKIKKYPGSK